MLKQMHISPRQFFILTLGLSVGTSILLTPSGLAHTAREDAWLASLFSLLINLAMTALYIAISRLYPGKCLFDIHEKALGKIPGKALNFLYLFYFLILIGTLLGNLGFFFSSEVMPETPIEAFQLLFLVAAVMCARLGIVILARVGELMLPWFILLFLVFTLSLVPQIEWDYIRPMLEDGVGPVLAAGFHASMFQELIVMSVFFPLVAGYKQGERAWLGGATAGGLTLTAIALLSVLVLGIEQTENSTFPAFALAKTINIGDFFQRVEGILITIWVLTFFIKISLLFLSFLQGIQSIFRLKEHTALIYPLAVLSIIVAWNTYINTVYIAEIVQHVFVGYALLHLIVVPCFIVVIGLFRKLGKRGR